MLMIRKEKYPHTLSLPIKPPPAKKETVPTKQDDKGPPDWWNYID